MSVEPAETVPPGDWSHFPPWQDEFNLQPYFKNVQPQFYRFVDAADYVPAQELSRFVQLVAVRWIAVYRSAILSFPRNPDILGAVLFCLWKMESVDEPSYRRWYIAPEVKFANRSPREMFLEHSSEDLSQLWTLAGGSGPCVRQLARRHLLPMVAIVLARWQALNLFLLNLASTPLIAMTLSNGCSPITNSTWKMNSSWRLYLPVCGGVNPTSIRSRIT
jgi:hypothetical protein